MDATEQVKLAISNTNLWDSCGFSWFFFLSFVLLVGGFASSSPTYPRNVVWSLSKSFLSCLVNPTHTEWQWRNVNVFVIFYSNYVSISPICANQTAN